MGSTAPGRRLRACFVTPWYGRDIPGGAEAEARRTAQNLAAAGVEVTVLATCLSGLGGDWSRDALPKGESVEDGVRVLRFPTARRSAARFELLNAKVGAGASLSDEQEREFFENMVHSPALLEHLAAHPEAGPFFFIPYLFTTSVLGPLIHPDKSVLIPCLHDEGYARMRSVRRVFEAARAVAFHVPAERDLAASLFDLSRTEPLVIGEGIDTGWSADAARFRRAFGVDGPFILYAGRKDRGKNTPLLITYFLRYVAERAGAGGLKLVLIGNAAVPIPAAGRESVLDLGFVGRQDKYDAYAAAAVLVQPSLLESFSIVIMESWLAGTPVLVHSGCAVTRAHVEASGGGLHFADYPRFAESLDLLLARPELRSRMAAAGKAYVEAEYSWPQVTARYLALIERVGAERARPAPALTATAADAPPGPAVHQLLPDLAPGDAIGNDVLAIRKALRSWGLRSEVFASHIHDRLRGEARPAEEYARAAGPDDVVIFHFSIGHPLADEFPALPGRKVVRYHNITPAHYLEGVHPAGAERCALGRRQLPLVAAAAELGIGDSDYNCAELAEAGCRAVAEVPILLDLAVLETPPDPRTLSRLSGGGPLVLHVGRIVPNKRIDDLIRTHYWLTRLLPGARLLLVGGGKSNAYGLGLKEMIRELEVPGVRFAGHVSNAVMTAAYRAAGAYLCLSEHEGFCVPLVEAMHFGLPIVARAAAAVPGTLGNGGVLLERPDPLVTAELLARILSRDELRRALGARSRQRIEAFRPAVVEGLLRRVLKQRLGLETGP